MKTAAILFLLLLIGCGGDDPTTVPVAPPPVLTYCFVFTATNVKSVAPPIAGYGGTVVSVTTACGLTDSEAKGVSDKLTTRSVVVSSGYTFTDVTTCVYRRK